MSSRGRPVRVGRARSGVSYFKIQFIIEVKKNGGVAQCIQAWKSLPSVPATLYIVVPKELLSEAKKVAQIVGLSTRFGSYTISNDDVKVEYE